MNALYRIRDWENLYETAETRKLENLRWVPIPNKHDGLGFRRLAQQRNRCELLGAWLLIVQVASKGRRGQRGVLARDGQPLDIEDLALMTGFPAPVFKDALTFFSDPKQGWLIVEGISPTHVRPAPAGTAQSRETGPDTTSRPVDSDLPPDASPMRPADSPASPADSPAEGREGRKEEKVENGTEGKSADVRSRSAEAEPDIPPLLNSPEFIAAWKEWQRIRMKGKKPKSSWPDYFAKQLAWLNNLGPSGALESVSHSARNEYQGLFDRRSGGGRNATRTMSFA